MDKDTWQLNCVYVLLQLHTITNIQLAGKLHVRQMFVKEADSIVSYLEPSMEIVGR